MSTMRELIQCYADVGVISDYAQEYGVELKNRNVLNLCVHAERLTLVCDIVYTFTSDVPEDWRPYGGFSDHVGMSAVCPIGQYCDTILGSIFHDAWISSVNSTRVQDQRFWDLIGHAFGLGVYYLHSYVYDIFLLRMRPLNNVPNLLSWLSQWFQITILSGGPEIVCQFAMLPTFKYINPSTQRIPCK